MSLYILKQFTLNSFFSVIYQSRLNQCFPPLSLIVSLSVLVTDISTVAHDARTWYYWISTETAREMNVCLLYTVV